MRLQHIQNDYSTEALIAKHKNQDDLQALQQNHVSRTQNLVLLNTFQGISGICGKESRRRFF